MQLQGEQLLSDTGAVAAVIIWYPPFSLPAIHPATDADPTYHPCNSGSKLCLISRLNFCPVYQFIFGSNCQIVTISDSKTTKNL